MAVKPVPFTDTLKTWHADPGTAAKPVRMIEGPSKSSGIPPMPETPEREFADHMDRAQQAVKDWVRKELHLAMHGISHEDRVKTNP